MTPPCSVSLPQRTKAHPSSPRSLAHISRPSADPHKREQIPFTAIEVTVAAPNAIPHIQYLIFQKRPRHAQVSLSPSTDNTSLNQPVLVLSPQRSADQHEHKHHLTTTIQVTAAAYNIISHIPQLFATKMTPPCSVSLPQRTKAHPSSPRSLAHISQPSADPHKREQTPFTAIEVTVATPNAIPHIQYLIFQKRPRHAQVSLSPSTDKTSLNQPVLVLSPQRSADQHEHKHHLTTTIQVTAAAYNIISQIP
jgi:hypothetical protein